MRGIFILNPQMTSSKPGAIVRVRAFSHHRRQSLCIRCLALQYFAGPAFLETKYPLRNVTMGLITIWIGLNQVQKTILVEIDQTSPIIPPFWIDPKHIFRPVVIGGYPGAFFWIPLQHSLMARVGHEQLVDSVVIQIHYLQSLRRSAVSGFHGFAMEPELTNQTGVRLPLTFLE